MHAEYMDSSVELAARRFSEWLLSWPGEEHPPADMVAFKYAEILAAVQAEMGPQPPAVPSHLGQLYTPDEIAQYLRVTGKTVRLWLRNGHLRGIKLGPKEWRVQQAELMRFLSAAPEAEESP
jgi:excisionase family DNA binding protein